ncbi:MAG: hypothetical protein ACK4QW_03065 [Alphaproteobacteria bacterium]
MADRAHRGRAVAAMAVILLGLQACGGRPMYTQEQDYDIIDCSLAGWGTSPMPRQACLDQGGLPL